MNIVLANTDELLTVARNIWKEAASHKFAMENSSPDSEMYIIFIKGKAIGTVEFTPYNPRIFSTVENDYKFSEKYPILNDCKGFVWEIDKLCLLPEYQFKGYILNVLEVIAYHIKLHNVKFYVALMDKRFYVGMKKYHRFPIGQVEGTEEFVAKGDKESVVPVIVDAVKCLKKFEDKYGAVTQSK